MAKLELLAPAGSFDALKAAVINGADAVYLGLENFSARDKAQNFNIDGLDAAIKYAHLFGVKVYIAMNTLIKDCELNDALDLAKKAYTLNAYAFIVQDIGFLTLLKKELPDVCIHASTQMGIHNVFGAKAAQNLGVKRAILSRETTLEDIKQIKDNTNLEIEFFVHGALCVGFSGNCYFSSLVSGYSGNRGKCMQLCRKKYLLESDNSRKEQFWLSTKDLCLLENLKELVNAGVTSFKIEGRMRREEYVGEAVRAYRHAIDSIINSQNKDYKEDIKNLKLMYNRGDYTKAHLYSPTSNVVFPQIQNHIGVKIGTVKSVDGKIAKLNLTQPLVKNDGLKFIRDNLETGSALINNGGYETTFSGKVLAGDEVRLTSSASLINEINKRNRKIPVNCSVKLIKNSPFILTASYNNIKVCVTGENVTGAISAPLTKEQLVKTITQAGDSEIELNLVDIKFDDNAFYPLSKIKTIRRELIEKLKEEILKHYAETSLNTGSMLDIVPKTYNFKGIFNDLSNIFVQTEDYKNFDIDCDYVVYNPKTYGLDDCTLFYSQYKDKAVLNLPNIARDNDLSVLQEIIDKSGINNFIVNNIYGLEMCKDKNIVLGIFMNQLNNAFNIQSINSIESSNFSTQNLNYIFGKAPLMTFTHCMKKNYRRMCEKDCQGYNNNDFCLTDELKNKFEVRRYMLENCYGQMLNSVPVYLYDKAVSKNIKNMFFDFTGYDSSMQKDIYNKIITNSLTENFKFTRGNYSKSLK